MRRTVVRIDQLVELGKAEGSRVEERALTEDSMDISKVMAIREDIRQGIIDTVPMKRLGRPDEIGDLCAYLASDKAAYITGATININGGLHMC